MRRAHLILAMPLMVALGGCQDLLLDPGYRVAGDYDAWWSWEVDVYGASEDDRGSCRGRLELDETGLEEFRGVQELPPFRSCLPSASGRVIAEVSRSGHVRMALELPYGGWGVFPEERGCDLIRADQVLTGTFHAGRIRVRADARYRCWVWDRWRDVDVELELDAERFGVFGR